MWGRYVFLALWLLWGQPVLAASADATTLLGIEGFRIEIEAPSKTARALGVDEVHLEGLTRERLKRGALPVGDFSAVLVVSLRTIEHPTTVLAYCLEVQVRQVMQLTRTAQMQMLAPTWSEGKLTMVVRASFVQSVTVALTELLDKLIADYRLVNKNPA